MPGGVTIDVKIEDGEFKNLLVNMQRKVGNLTPAMKIAGKIVRDSVRENFREGGRPDKWRPSKRAIATGGKTLIKDKRLMNSITYKAFGDRAEVGTNVIYAAIHQLGGKAGRGRKVTIPARPYLMIQDEDWTEIKEALSDYLMGGVNR